MNVTVRGCRFTVKSTTDSGRKVFINMCSSEHVAAPESWADGVMPDHVRNSVGTMQEDSELSAEQSQALRIPLSLSEERSDHDKHGAPCTVFDCIFAVEVMKEAAAFRAMKIFVIETVIGWINHKHKLGIDSKFKLPKLKYKGDTIHAHRIRKDPKKLVTEVQQLDSVDEEPSIALRANRGPAKHKKAAGTSADQLVKAHPGSVASKQQAQAAEKENDMSVQHLAASGTAVHKLVLQSLDYAGKPCQHVTAIVSLPAADDAQARADGVTVKAAIDAFHVQCAGCTPLAVALNLYVRQSSCKCRLRDQELRISADVLPVSELIEQAEQSRPLPLGSIQLQSERFASELD